MVQFSSNKRVVMIGNDGVVVYGPSGSGVERELSLAWDLPTFDTALAEALSRHNADVPVTVLFDGVDQTYRPETNIPKLSPIDRPRFVRRKLEMAFPNYPIRAFLEVRPERAGKRLGKGPLSYLFVALPETDQIDRVAHALLESGVAVAGLGLLPVESIGLAPTLAAKLFAGGADTPSRWTVLIGQHETGGLRQVVVKDGTLALTRMTPMADGAVTGAAWAEEVTRLFRATMTYISRFGFNSDDGIDVIIVCDDVSRQFFSAADLGVKRLRCVTTADALKLIGAKSFGLDKTNFADALHAAWASKKRRLTLPMRVPGLHRIMAPRLAARAAATLLVFGALALAFMTGSALQQNYVLYQEVEQREAQRAVLERELAAESKIFDTLPVKATLLKGTLGVKKTLDDNTVKVDVVMQRVKSVLGAGISINSIDYVHQPSPTLVLDGTQAARPQPPVAGIGAAAASPRGRITLTLRFSLPATIPLEQKVSTTEALQKKLGEAFPGSTVTIDSQFGRVDRGGRFEGNLTGGESASTGRDEAQITVEGPAP